MSFKLGLTGSIGMGKSTTAHLFREMEIPVWDADAAVHELYAKDGAGAEAIAQLSPGVIVQAGVDRALLRAEIEKDPTLLKKVEAAIHPLVGVHRAEFIRSETAPILVFDIPLIFETGIGDEFDAVAVVSAPYELQKTRVLERATMDEASFELILSKQVPDAEKRAKADYVIDTTSFATAKRDVRIVIEDIERRIADA